MRVHARVCVCMCVHGADVPQALGMRSAAPGLGPFTCDCPHFADEAMGTWRGSPTLKSPGHAGRTEAHLDLGCPPPVIRNVFLFFWAWPGHGKPHMWFCGGPYRPKNSQQEPRGSPLVSGRRPTCQAATAPLCPTQAQVLSRGSQMVGYMYGVLEAVPGM